MEVGKTKAAIDNTTLSRYLVAHYGADRCSAVAASVAGLAYEGRW